MNSQITRPITSENSELVTFSSHSHHSMYIVENAGKHNISQTSTSVEPQHQQFLKMLAAKGIAAETIMKFTVLNVWNHYICKLLSSIVTVVNNADQVLRIHNFLQTITGQVLVMLVS